MDTLKNWIFNNNLFRYNYGEVEKRPCTIPQPFNLAIASKPFSKPQPPEEHVEPFHSRPLNKKILQGPTGWDQSVVRIYFIFIQIRLENKWIQLMNIC